MNLIENPPVVVLLARQFNPSVLSQVWLAKNGILDADGTVRANSIFAENFVQVITDEFVLAVLPEQLQFIPNVLPERQQKLIEDKLGTLVGKLPHVPYRSVGLNFNWHLAVNDEEVPSVTRNLFAGKQDGIFERFSDPNARFGTYLSKDFGPFRMKVDIKPVSIELPGGEKVDRIQFGFNFHSDFLQDQEAAKEAARRFSEWDIVRNEAVQTLTAAGLGQSS
ncbi:hypothetical protein [Fimbriiglobus ruber]|uniref:hypothetical protein n=1 Tax=Fimbriiglobus ruber TaxID=1908690 RepID=UPI000B4AAA04|nr:hypothetical protein [Fimbriiglobus ruber]